MMQKFGLRGERQPIASTQGVCSYGKRIVEEMKTQNTEKFNMQQPRAYYYQMVPTPCLEDNEKLRLRDNLCTFSNPRRTRSETTAFVGTRMNPLLETMPFSRDSCSDTDSGICTDNGSECQQSPVCPAGSLSTTLAGGRVTASLDTCGMAVFGKGPLPAISMLPPPSSFKLRHQTTNRNAMPPSRLPSARVSQAQCPRRCKQPMKVRFADEVEGADHQNTSTLCRQQPAASVPPNTALTETGSSGHYYSMPPRIASTSRHQSPPPLPDYEMAVRRMREIGRHQRSASLPRRPDQEHQPSARQEINTSGLRICQNLNYRSGDYEENGQGLVVTRTRTAPRRATGDKRLSEAKSMENLSSSGDWNYERKKEHNCTENANLEVKISPSKSCENLQQPTALHRPLPMSASNSITTKEDTPGPLRQQPAQARNRPRFAHCMSSALQKIADNALQTTSENDSGNREQAPCTKPLPAPPPQPLPKQVAVKTMEKTTTLLRQPNNQAIPVNSFPASEAELAKYHNQGEPLCTDRLIETRLLGLDHQGIQLIELRKHDDKPFGFYIATGSFKKKKGIFVSRITVRGLFPLLAVGDQILDVDFQPVKGRSLEDVQRMISNTDRVILRTLPAVMR